MHITLIIIVILSFIVITINFDNVIGQELVYNGTTILVLKINNAYDPDGWITLDKYTSEGYNIKSIISGSTLDQNITYYTLNPSNVMIILQKNSIS